MVEITAQVTATLHIGGVDSASDAIVKAVEYMQQRKEQPRLEWKVISVQRDRDAVLGWRVDMFEGFK